MALPLSERKELPGTVWPGLRATSCRCSRRINSQKNGSATTRRKKPRVMASSSVPLNRNLATIPVVAQSKEARAIRSAPWIMTNCRLEKQTGKGISGKCVAL